jgi:hypothetical protein
MSSSGVPGDEDLVVTVGVQLRGDRLRWTSDIATGEGVILAEGPACEVPHSHSVGDWAGTQLHSTLEFLNRSEALLSDQLR